MRYEQRYSQARWSVVDTHENDRVVHQYGIGPKYYERSLWLRDALEKQEAARIRHRLLRVGSGDHVSGWASRLA